MEIRNFRQDDLETLCRFKAESARVSFPGGEVDVKFFRKNILRSVEKEPQSVKIAEAGGKIAGYVWIEIKRAEAGGYGNIHHIYVESNHRRTGLATTLLAAAETFFLSRGVKCAKATVTMTNNPSLGLLDGLGYKGKRVVLEKKL